MADMLQLTAECAYVTSNTASGRAKVLLYKGAVFPDDVPEARHLLDSGMAARVGGEVTGGVDASGTPDAVAADPDAETPQETPSGAADDSTGEPDGDKSTDRSKVKGGRPSAADKQALVAEAVAAGMDRGEAEKASVTDLRAALNKT